MHRDEYRRMAHKEVEEIFRKILPQAGMKVREEQITLCHQIVYDTLNLPKKSVRIP